MGKRQQAREEERFARGEIGVDGEAVEVEPDETEVEKSKAAEQTLRGRTYLGREFLTWLLWRTNGGAGLATELGSHALAYAFVEATADVSGALQPEWAIGAGATAGLFLGDPSDRWRAHLHAGAMGFALGDAHLALSAGLDQRLRLSRDVALELSLGVTREFDETWSEVGLYLRRYF